MRSVPRVGARVQTVAKPRSGIYGRLKGTRQLLCVVALLRKRATIEHDVHPIKLFEPIEIMICGANVCTSTQKSVGYACRVDVHRSVLGEVQHLWKAHAKGAGVAKTGRTTVYHKFEWEAVDHFLVFDI